MKIACRRVSSSCRTSSEVCHAPRRAAALAIAAGLLLPSAALACLWDHDTIQMERARFPSALELITGKFLRHSPEFYRWRIEDRQRRLESDPANAALLDDLAAAYDKTGRHDKAIETAQKTERLRPGRYETAANLGTFYFHAGKLDEGIPHIDRALRINPDAHFGREKYQKLLVQYVIERKKGGPLKLPLAEVAVSDDVPADKVGPHDVTVSNTFASFLRSRDSLKREEVDAAAKGILGMMKFGKHDSPVLLEALGVLLGGSNGLDLEHDAKLLAARAFLKASYEVPDGPARVSYRRMAAHALAWQEPRAEGSLKDPVGVVERDFLKELEEGRAWYADLRERELSWIREGKDPEAEFDKLYDREPEVSGMDVKDPMSPAERERWLLIGLGIGCAIGLVVALVGVVLVVRNVRRRRGAGRAGSVSDGALPARRDHYSLTAFFTSSNAVSASLLAASHLSAAAFSSSSSFFLAASRFAADSFHFASSAAFSAPVALSAFAFSSSTCLSRTPNCVLYAATASSFLVTGLVSFVLLHPTASPTTPASAQQITHVRNMT